ncbi:hypothetical protein E4U41_004840 [Claviceps citrina]|nr:hypothetical protein E4U41_004840 [Claviceps citrina]
MASYDSDSSDGEFTETKVLLGYAFKDAKDETISKLGGRPLYPANPAKSAFGVLDTSRVLRDWTDSTEKDWLDSEKPPSAALARCRSCKDIMSLILQLNAELPEKFPGHDRRLYVFACKRTTCRRKNGSIRALRGVRVWSHEEEEEEEAVRVPEADASPRQEGPKAGSMDYGPGLGDALFGGKVFGGGASSSAGANPFSSGNTNPFSSQDDNASSNPFGASPPQPQKEAETEAESPRLSKSFAETLSLNNNSSSSSNDEPASSSPPPHEPWPESPSEHPPPYPTLYLAEADYETLDLAPPSKIPDHAQMEDADAPETVSALDKEAFESSMDATFQKFADRLAQNPDQVIRYEFEGAPLLYSKTDAVGETLSRGSLPACPHCGGRRVFEVQLTPNAIAELEADDLGLEGMEWGTIIVGVCARDCVPSYVEDGEAGYLEEWAGVQWEELVKEK